jgi:hypothetical protein
MVENPCADQEITTSTSLWTSYSRLLENIERDVADIQVNNAQATTSNIRPAQFYCHTSEDPACFLDKFADWMDHCKVAPPQWTAKFGLWLNGSASHWWRELDPAIRQGHNFDHARDAFLERFSNDAALYIQQMRFNDTRQTPTQSLDDYINKFQSACARLQIPEYERRILFVKGLHVNLRSAV